MLRSCLRIIATLALLAQCPLSWGGPQHTFLYPNELNPELSKPILNRSTEAGAYVSVGTERGLIGAALSPHANYILLVDQDPKVVRYNQINIELLKHSQSRENYLRLRMSQNFDEWKGTLSQDDFDWWKEVTRSKHPRNQYFQQKPAESAYAAFKDANYLHDDALFAKIQNLAKTNRIEVVASYIEGEPFKLAIENLKKKNIAINVLDISNVWTEAYAGAKSTNQVLNDLKRAGALKPKSVVMITHPTGFKYYRNGERAKEPLFTIESEELSKKAWSDYNWQYHGYEAQFLEKEGKLTLPLKDKNFTIDHPHQKFSTFNAENVDLYGVTDSSDPNCLMRVLRWFK
jgi:hypothetical protein